MPKSVFAIVVLLLIAAGAFGADFVAGVSATGGYSFSLQKASLAGEAVTSQTVDMSLPVSASVFGDFQYLSLGFGVTAELLRRETETQAVGGTVTTIYDTAAGTRVFLTVTALLELPVAFGSFVLVPLAGLEGDICVAAMDAQGNDLTTGMTQAQRADLHEAWLKAGAELRIPLAGGISLRPWFLAGYKLPNAGETTVQMNLQTAGFDALLLSLRAQAGLALGFGL